MLGLFNQALPSDLDSILDTPELKSAQVGACVTDGHGHVLYARNHKVLFVPASNQKVFSVMFAMEKLGADTVLKTKFWKNSNSIVVDSVGDPSLRLDQLRQIRKSFGIEPSTPIQVKLKFATSLAPGWEWDDLPWYYAAPVSSFSCDHASFEVWASKGMVEPLPSELDVKLVRQPSTSPKSVSFDPKTKILRVTGGLPQKRERLGTFAQLDPVALACRALGGTFAQSGTSELPKREPDVTIESPSVALLAQECLEQSDNNAAEQLLAIAALDQTGSPVSPYPFAPDRLRTFFEKVSDIDPGDFRPVDASGLSRHDLVTPHAVCAALERPLSQPYRDQWLAALPRAGEGTLKSRLKNSTFIGKTGTMDAVVCLSGYVKAKDGTLLTVSLLFNNALASNSELRSIQDRFVRKLEQGTVSYGLPTHNRPVISNNVPNQGHRALNGHWLPGFSDDGLAPFTGANR